MTEAVARLLIQTRAVLGNNESGTVGWSAELSREADAGTEQVTSAFGRTFEYRVDQDMVEAYEEISDEYAGMALAAEESDVLRAGLADPLLIINLVVAPQWRGHNIGPHLLRWMASSIPGVNTVFLVPVPLPTRLDDAGRWVSDWDTPRSGSGAMRKVRRAYRKGGFTHLRAGTWWTTIADWHAEMAPIEEVMAVLER